MGRGYRIVITAFTIVLGLPCFSEEAPTAEFEFKVFGVGRDDYEGLYYYTGETFEPLEFHRTHRSVRTYSYKGPVTFGIYVKNPDYVATDPESAPYLRISSSIAPVGAERQLIVFAASSQNREVSDTQRKFTLYHIDDSPEAFPGNTIIAINTTGAELYGRVADSRISLPRGYSKPIPYASGASNDTATNIAFALETKEGARLVMSNDIRIPENRRVLLVLEPPRRQGSMRIAVRLLSESVFPDEEADAN